MRKHRDRARELDRQLKSERDRRAYAEDKLNGHGVYDDPKTQLRHEIAVACRRIAADLGTNGAPAREYTLGPEFLESLDALQGIDRPAIVEKIGRLLIGAPNAHGHPLRTSEAGNDPEVIRDTDHARAFRLYLQQGTPSARRLHYWRLPDGGIELSNVGVHDAVGIR